MSAPVHGELCLSCGRTNCRVRYWQEIVEIILGADSDERARVHLPLEDAERALASAKVSCFIRSKGRRLGFP